MIIEKKADSEVKEEITTEEVVVEAPIVDEEKRKLELENAELRGKASAFESLSKNVPSGTIQADPNAWKGIFLADLNSLDDESFQTKYKNSKMQANTAFLQNEFATQSASQNQKFAKIEADNKLLTKYDDLYEYDKEIQEALRDASPEVKADPERLSKVIERAYLAATKSAPKAKEPMERKNLNAGFEKPQPRKESSKKETSDEIPDEYRSVCNKMGITSEKERQSLMESDDVETHFGRDNSGKQIVFRDRAKGFERVA